MTSVYYIVSYSLHFLYGGLILRNSVSSVWDSCKLQTYLRVMPLSCVGEWKYTSPLSWPRLYMDMSGQLHAISSLPPRKLPLASKGQGAGWTSQPVWTWQLRHKSLVADGNRTPVVQRSHYIDWKNRNLIRLTTFSVELKLTKSVKIRLVVS
jgi:hypothetical protein